MDNRQQVTDTVAYLCKKANTVFDEIAPTKDRTTGDGTRMKFVESFVSCCLQIASNDRLDVLNVKAASEIAEEEAKAAAIKS